MNIRVANVEDAERINMLNRQIGSSPSLCRTKETLANAIASENQLILVAEVCGLVSGYIVIQLLSVLHDDKPTGRISALVVDETFREMTIGTQLLDSAAQFFKNKGCNRMEMCSPVCQEDHDGFHLLVGYKITPKRYLKLIASQQMLAEQSNKVCRPAHGWS
ncbi:GNAT family N-acetyltransferase [Veronia nyctiphanis]|nr:GNAT family N-acetyltransferase [Veronia nyctiphanis]